MICYCLNCLFSAQIIGFIAWRFIYVRNSYFKSFAKCRHEWWTKPRPVCHIEIICLQHKTKNDLFHQSVANKRMKRSQTAIKSLFLWIQITDNCPSQPLSKKKWNPLLISILEMVLSFWSISNLQSRSWNQHSTKETTTKTGTFGREI